jgi:hypothetical protein
LASRRKRKKISPSVSHKATTGGKCMQLRR